MSTLLTITSPRSAKFTFALLLALLAGCSSISTDYRPSTWELLNLEFKKLHRTGQYEQAEVVARQSLQIAEGYFSSVPYIAESQDNLALLYKPKGGTERLNLCTSGPWR
jgi:hypothetical protein